MAADGKTITFIINGEVVATFTNDELSQGEFGLYTEGNSAPFTAIFDDIFIAEYNKDLVARTKVIAG